MLEIPINYEGCREEAARPADRKQSPVLARFEGKGWLEMRLGQAQAPDVERLELRGRDA